MYFLVIPWTQRAYVCVVDTARINKLPNNLDRLYSRGFAKHISSTVTNLPSSLTFETRIETDPPTARRIVQRWITSANQERGRGRLSRQKELEGEEGNENVSLADSAPIIVLLHAPSSSTTLSPSGDAPWPLGEAMINRRRAPQLTSLAEMPVVPLGGTGDEERVSEGVPDDAYSVLKWQSTVVKRAIRFYLQVNYYTLVIGLFLKCIKFVVAFPVSRRHDLKTNWSWPGTSTFQWEMCRSPRHQFVCKRLGTVPQLSRLRNSDATFFSRVICGSRTKFCGRRVRHNRISVERRCTIRDCCLKWRRLM